MAGYTHRQQSIRVVVLGAGYAGLAFVRGLLRARVPGLSITLVDRNAYHTLLTETHTVAAGSRPAALVEIPLSALGAGVQVMTAAVTGVDVKRRLVALDTGELAYDFLAVCLGGKDNDFGTPGVQEHALFLRGRQDAQRIHARIQALSPGAGVVIVGGGLTGVELAAEIAIHGSHRRSVTVVEAAPSLLPGLPAGIQQRARRRLGWLGVNVTTAGRVVRITDDQVHLADGSVLTCGLVIWTAGVKGHPLLADMGVATDRGGRAVLDQYLHSSLLDVYILGDCAAFQLAPHLPPAAPSAQLAEQMGFAAAADLGSRLRGGQGRAFVPHLQGVLCDLGGINATGLVHRFHVHGVLAAIAKRFSVLRHLWNTFGIRGLLLHLRAVGGKNAAVVEDTAH